MTGHLLTEPRLADPDGLYETLLGAYRELSEEDALKFSAKLILLLANHIGEPDVIREALAAAGGGEAT